MTNSAWYRVTPVTEGRPGASFLVLVVTNLVAACSSIEPQVGDEWIPLLSLYEKRGWTVEVEAHV